MPSYLVETYLARGRADERDARELRAMSSAAELTQKGTRVHFERSVYVPSDEVCFFIFVAETAADATVAAQQAALEPIRVVEALSSPQGGS